MNMQQTTKRSRLVSSCGSRVSARLPRDARQGGFSLTELLVVIGIIVILIGILIPTVSKVRQGGYRTKSLAYIGAITSAMERYHMDYRAYPGPLSNNQIAQNAAGTGPIYIRLADGTDWTPVGQLQGVTMAENVFLGLSGGLEQNPNNGTIFYRPNLAGTGPRVLGGLNANRALPAFLDGIPHSGTLPKSSMADSLGGNWGPGWFVDDGAIGNDSIVPEYVDAFADPMPFLILRSRVGVNITGAQTSTSNPVITEGGNGPYDVAQIIAYTTPDTNGNYIGVGKDTGKRSRYVNAVAEFPSHGLRGANPGATLQSQFPYDAYAMFGAPNYYNATTNRFSQPRQKDGFIIIGAGPDRIYGTDDDIVSFGDLNR